MTTLLAPPQHAIQTIADLLERLGDIPPERIRFHPPPGTAKERDLIAVKDRENRTCELIDGVLVEKAVGIRKSLLAGLIGTVLRIFVDPLNLGLVLGADCALRLVPGLVRVPDVTFLAWGAIPGGRVPEEAIPQIAPTLAVEVVSKSNTPKEMARKRREFFAAGTRLVWMVEPRKRTVTVFTGPEQAVTLDDSQTLDGGEVLPGFSRCQACDLFAELDRQGPR